MIETYKFCNPHPQGKLLGDCVKRAICLAESSDYHETQINLNRLKRELHLKKYNESGVWKEYFLRHGYNKISFPAVKDEKRMDGYSFAESHPTGSYILRMSHHLTACVDGVILDTLDCRSKCVYNAYKVR